MFLSRRKLLNYINCTGIAAISTPIFGAINTNGNTHHLDYFKFTIGNIKITVVSDGGFQLPISSIDINSTEESLKKHLRKYHMPDEHIYMNTNLAVIEVGENKLIIDVGSGSRFIGSTGKLFDNLSKANIDPDSITHVFLTHAHPDHILGIRDDFDETIFPNAKFMISEKEFNWWTKKDRVNEVEETFIQMVLWAQNSLNAIPEISLFTNEKSILPGITAFDTSGHSPGHSSILVESEGSKLIIGGDVFRNTYTSLKNPDFIPDTDMDPVKAKKTRHEILDLLTKEKIAYLGYHFPFPGVGHIIAHEKSYEFIPASIRW